MTKPEIMLKLLPGESVRLTGPASIEMVAPKAVGPTAGKLTTSAGASAAKPVALAKGAAPLGTKTVIVPKALGPTAGKLTTSAGASAAKPAMLAKGAAPLGTKAAIAAKAAAPAAAASGMGGSSACMATESAAMAGKIGQAATAILGKVAKDAGAVTKLGVLPGISPLMSLKVAPFSKLFVGGGAGLGCGMGLGAIGVAPVLVAGGVGLAGYLVYRRSRAMMLKSRSGKLRKQAQALDQQSEALWPVGL
jgi:hypothetical protein